VNLVSSWDWTDSAHDARVDGTNLPYRTDGSREGLARHDIFIKEGYIRALSPQERARRFIGLYFNAKRSTSHSLYETVTAGINDQVWENLVKPETKEAIDAFYADAPELWDAVDIRSGRELWEAWGRYEEDFEEFAANALDIAIERGPSTRVADQTSYDKLRSFIKIPEKEKSWGTSWPGTDVDSLAKRWSNVTLDANDFTEDVRNLAKAIEVDLTVGMTVEQLYNGVQSVDVDLRTPVAAHVGPAYKSYIGERSAASREVDEHMRSIANNTRYSENWRQGVSEFLDFSESIQERYRGATLGIPAEEQLEVQSRYMALMNTANDTVVTDWQQLWDMRYERTYGPLGWEPPEPLSPFHDDGSLINGAYQPFIQSLIDGDSIVVTSRNGDMQPHEVRLLGVRARDYGLDDEGAKDDKYRLWDRLQQAIVDGDRIYLVRQAETFGNVDIYGRELAWLWIGDEPFYFAEEMLPTRDPSGGDS